MTSTIEFKPTWASPPGDTILDLLSERNLSIANLSDYIGYTSSNTGRLLSGNIEIDHNIAQKLATFFDTSEVFWMNRESQYRQGIVSPSISMQPIDPKSWLKDFPISDMVKLGWISVDRTFEKRFNACLDFFGVSSIDEWKKQYENQVLPVSFKTSEKFENRQKSLISWLRHGVNSAQRIHCSPWNPERLKEEIPNLRSLTREKRLSSFLSEIKKICASCGVAVVISQTPKNCHTSGATFFLSQEKALLMLSCRFKSDDHFWFTFFHEIGHLLLHKRQTFVEGKDMDFGEEEKQADNFSREVLIPKSFQDEFSHLIFRNSEIHNARRIMKFAKKYGISPGIVVGQLQKQNFISHKRLNKLKLRFSTEDIRREEANF